MDILSLDLGTKTGWALLKNGEIQSGTWVLATPKEVKAQRLADRDRCCEMRIPRLLRLIEGLQPVEQIWFEDVQFATTTYQAHLWASLRAMVIIQSGKSTVKAVPVGTLKKFATGSGAADKEFMRRTLAKTVPAERLAKMDDNEIDAYHLLLMARRDLNV